jgi:sugar/nucleoside kinase (ribokinase family)
MNSRPARRPMLVGTVVLDILHHGLMGEDLPPVRLRWGGVVSNMACALGALGFQPQFVSVAYEGEMDDAAASHLSVNDVDWFRLPVRAPMPLFHAKLVGCDASAEHFIGEHALTALTPDIFESHAEIFDSAGIIVSCTDLPVSTLSLLARMAAERSIPYWLLSAHMSEAAKLRYISPQPACISLNIAELAAWHGSGLMLFSDAIKALHTLLPPHGRALLTLGSQGALIVAAEDSPIIYQPAAMLSADISSLGAGDVMFGSLLAAHLAQVDWPEALAQATARTAAYLSAPVATVRPYLLLRAPQEIPSGRIWSDADECNTELQTSPDIRGDS